ncbi:MAG TPA: hypothetical protein VHE30_30220 [Polyangiaceae bacterium]|nr:hypothetical protein [Polyangiaceae bacterium]
MFTRIAVLAAFAGVLFGAPAYAETSCKSGERPTLGGCRSGTAALGATVTPPAPVQAPPAPKAPPKPDVSLRPDPSALEARSRALLVEEIARLEKLVQGLPRKARDRAMIVRRLGDDYSDLVRIEEREYVTKDAEAERLRKQVEADDRPRVTREPEPPSPPRRPIRL